MQVKRYAMVRDNVVYSVTLWDGNEATWQPPQDGTLMIQSDSAAPNDWWEEAEGIFYRPILPTPAIEETDTEESDEA